MTDRGRTTHVLARGKTRKKPGSIFHRTPSSPTPFGRSRRDGETTIKIQGEIIYPPPPSPPISARRPFSERGWGGCIYFEASRGRILCPPPLLYTPPTSRRVFSGVGGWGCIKFGPVKNKSFTFKGGRGGSWGQRGKSSKNAVFHGERHGNKLLKVQILLSRNFVVIAQAPRNNNLAWSFQSRLETSVPREIQNLDLQSSPTKRKGLGGWPAWKCQSGSQTGLENFNPRGRSLGWRVCRTNFAWMIFFVLRNSSRKMFRSFPRNFRAFISWVRKNPAKFPPNFPPKNQKKSPTSFCRSAGRRDLDCFSILVL